MLRFTAETPLGQDVQALLRASEPNGVTLGELRRRLRLERGKVVSPENLQELLRDSRVFSLRADGRYMLATAPAAPASTAADVSDARSAHWPAPLLSSIPQARNSYIVFDLETTGLDPTHDRIIQIAALKVIDGKPTAFVNSYAHPGDIEIPYTLQITLGMDRDPNLARHIAEADPIDMMLGRFMVFAGGLPLVAHNARFDGGFLRAALSEVNLPNPLIDTMELALLVAPELESHQLAQLGEHLGVPVDSLGAEWSALGLADPADAAYVVSSETLHNAATDVYLLHRVYRRLLEEIEQPGAKRDLLAQLLPEMFESDAVYSHCSAEAFAPFLVACRWHADPQPAPSASSVSARRLLDDFLTTKGHSPRPAQVEMQATITQAMAQEKFAMVEAPTGTGKTLAYLTAAIEQARASGRKVALSTAYRNLQDQLIHEIDELQERGGVRFSSQVLKGVSNYLCWSKLVQYLDEGAKSHDNKPLSLDERFTLAYIGLRLPHMRHGVADELSFWLLETIPTSRAVVHQVRASAVCRSQSLPHCGGCPMPAVYANAATADILVINHALWLSAPQQMPAFPFLVLDEAHTLEDVATAALTQEVSSDSLSDVLTRLLDERTGRGLLPRLRSSARGNPPLLDATAGALNSLRRTVAYIPGFGTFVAQFIRRCTNEIDPRYGASMRMEAPPWKVHATRWPDLNQAHRQLFGIYLKDLLDALGRVYQALLDAPGLPHWNAHRQELSEILKTLGEQRQFAYDAVKVSNQKQVYWLEVGPPRDPKQVARDPTPDAWALKAAPINVGEALQPFYDRHSSVSFVSATLALRRNDFSFFVERLGLADRLEAPFIRELPPALPYDANVFLGLADYLTHAPLQTTMESFKEELASELSLFLRFTDGRALGLFTARERMQQIAEKLTAVLARHGLPLYVQTPGSSRRRLLESFRARKEATLFGLRSFWEGVDVSGESLSFVLMEKLPFPLLTEPVHRARAEHLLQAGKSEFDDYMLPLMLLQIKQGFGRLIRSETDRGAVVLFDRRIHRKYYKADLLATLPGFIPRDEDNERSRRRFYEAIATALPGLIDLDAKRSLLLELPEDLLLDMERKIGEYTLPLRIEDVDYPTWRPTVLAGLQAIFGHPDFRRIHDQNLQEDVVRHILAGRDVLGVLPTGSGKSLTFQLTALLRPGMTLVLSPLIALMKDQAANLRARKIEIVGAIYSGQSASERDDVFERMRRGRVRLVYISPERLRDPQLLAALEDAQVIQVVIDEAHCVDMWGPSFRPDFLYVPRLYTLLKQRPPVAALTATATPEMQNSIVEQLELREPARVIASADRPELRFVVYNSRSRYGAISGPKDRFQSLMRILKAADAQRPPILIYVATTVEADQLAKQLRVAGLDARAYHGKMDAQERASVQDMFMDDHINVVVCTKAFGMGIDKPNIRYVIHYNLPSDIESYFQEAGRAGRDGQVAYCILLYLPRDISTQQFFIQNSTPDEESINGVLSYITRLRPAGRHAAQPARILYLDPEALQTQLDMEDAQLRVALHYLEAQSYLARGADFSLRGSLTFQVAPEEALAAWQQAGEKRSDLLSALLHKAHWPAYRKVEVDLMALADAAQTTPVKVEQALLRLSQRGEAIYRPWQRGIVVELLTKTTEGASVPPGVLATEQHRERMAAKLQAIVAYAQDNRLCRRATILRYFGESAPDQCGACDVCLAEEKWPWSLISDRDCATPDEFMDPAFVLLETAKWNLDRASKIGAPYGTGTLLAILKGDGYTVQSHTTDPHLRKWRLNQARACPYWGIFTTLTGRERVLGKVVQRLCDEEYLAVEKQPIGDGVEYDYLDLTEKGIEQLTSGRLLQWEFTS